METSCLRLRFTPLFKNIPKNNSKCCLEIVPEVSYIHNLDKIEWQQGDNSIEYTIPITYKVILKKKDETNMNSAETVKTYHSCVDLLIPSSLNDLDVEYSDITKIASDTVIFNKETNDIEFKPIEKTNAKEQKLNFKEVQTSESKPSVTSCTELITIGEQLKEREVKDDNTLIVKMLDSRCVNIIKKVYLLDKVTSTGLANEFRNQHTSAELLSYTGTLDCVSSTGGKVDRRLSITPICSINTQDGYVLDHGKGRTSNLIVLRIQEPHFSTSHGDKSYQKSSIEEKHGLHVIKTLKDNSFETLSNNSSERVLPEVRIAQFMRCIERELSPLKKKLNDIILKCSLLGFICHDNHFPMLYNSVAQGKKEMSCCEKESKSNRVVYSVVFDG